MSYLTQSEINQEEWERTRYDVRENGYTEGVCVCCGSDEGLNEDGIPCGYCRKGRELDKEE